jgi:nitrogen fixation protein FixH
MSHSRGVLTGRHVLSALLLFFGVVIAVNVAFIVAAVRSFPGEDAQHAYAAGLRFNEFVNARERQSALGWTAVLDTTRAGSVATLRVRMRDRAGAPLRRLELSGDMRRPAHAHDDHALSFKPAAPGLYVAQIPTVYGAWDVRVRAIGDRGETFNLKTRVVLP